MYRNYEPLRDTQGCGVEDRAFGASSVETIRGTAIKENAGPDDDTEPWIPQGVGRIGHPAQAFA